MLAFAALDAPMAAAQSDQQVTIDGARKVLTDLRHDKEFGNAAQLLRQAKAVMIVPKLLKGGFIVGGEGGNGVLMVQHKGGWSDPAFYALGAASFGLQVGLEQSEVVLLIMTQKGLDGVLQNRVQNRRPGRDFSGHLRVGGRGRHRRRVAAGYRRVVVRDRAVRRADGGRIGDPCGAEPGFGILRADADVARHFVRADR